MRMTSCLASTSILAAMLLLSVVPVQAQNTTNDWSRLRSLETGTTVSIKRKSGKSLRGTLNSVSDSTLSVTVKGTTQEIQRDEVQTVHQIVKKSATKATLIGLGVGAGAGAIAGTASGANDSDFDKLDKAATAAVTIIGAGVGAVAGYLIGRSANKKELIYEAR